jgi:hypothetical protein
MKVDKYILGQSYVDINDLCGRVASSQKIKKAKFGHKQPQKKAKFSNGKKAN